MSLEDAYYYLIVLGHTFMIGIMIGFLLVAVGW